MTVQRVHPRPKLYWELEDQERQAAVDARLVDGDEFYGLYQINRGRRFVRTMNEAGESIDPVIASPPVEVDGEGCEFFDAIASLLFAGTSQGFDPTYLLQAAASQYSAFVEEGRKHVDARAARDYPA